MYLARLLPRQGNYPSLVLLCRYNSSRVPTTDTAAPSLKPRDNELAEREPFPLPPYPATTVPGHPEIIIPRDIRDRAYPKIGNRDIVGFGLRGYPVYFDWRPKPFPAVRFGENTPEILALKDKEKGDWHNLTLDEKKKLYRHSFRMTYAEMRAPTGEWRYYLAMVLIAMGLTHLIFIQEMRVCWRGVDEDTLISSGVTDPFHKAMMLKKETILGHNRQAGPSRHFDYENICWRAEEF